MVFTAKPASIIWAKDATTGEYVTINGITREATTPETAVAQINKLLDIGGKSVTAAGMVRIGTEEAKDNG